MKIKNKILPILLVLMLFAGCRKNYTHQRYTKLLCSSEWIVNTYVDNSQNITIDTQYIIYKFYENGDLEKEYENGYIAKASWELYKDSDYIRIGNNIFKLQNLTKKLLSVRYGDIDIFFVSL